MEVCEGHVCEGVKVSMGMDDSEVIEYAGLKWVITWPVGFVVLVVNVWGKEKIIGTEVIWVMIA
jgi:hypothetical protein